MSPLRVFLVFFSAVVSLAAYASDSISISLATCYPGSDIYELEGHSALVISRPDQPDVAVTYGMFDFNAPNFVYRFVKGETDYMVGAVDWILFAESYRRAGRRVVCQRLNLSPEQTERLLEKVRFDLLPQNRTYRYNYVYDNCATRPLDAIRYAFAPDSICFGLTEWDSEGQTYTFRDVMRRYHVNYPWYQFGIDLALGSGIDYPLSPEQLAFCPMELENMIAGATVNGTPLVTETEVFVDLPAGLPVSGPTPWPLTPMAVCWAFCIVVLAVCVFDLYRRHISRWLDTVYYSIAGLAGCLITFLVFISVHEATSPNVLIWWLNPFCLLVPVFIWLKKFKFFVFSYQIINFVVVFVLMVASPWLTQRFNPAFYPLMLADLALAMRYLTLTYKQLQLTKNV